MRVNSQKGQAIVVLAMMMAVLVGFVALAIDSARAFDSRRILQDSVDAASLAAAESFQAGASWGVAEAAAMTLFARDNRLYGGDNCPAGGFVAPNVGSPVLTTCTVGGGSGYTLDITASDNGAAGQTFVLRAKRYLPIALMQVLSGSANILIQAIGGSVANDQSQTPALGALSLDNTCPGGTGVVSSLHIENQTNFMTIEGDVVSNGSLNMGGLSYLHLAGNALTRCAAPIFANHITYQCWLRDEPPPPACPPGEAAATAPYSTTNRLGDPGYLPVTTTSGSQGLPGSTVELKPGIYTADPNFGNNGSCYFLAAGVYEWQGGLTVNGGLVSNELKPPGEPGVQFWQQGHCSGDFALLAKPATVPQNSPLPSNSSYSVVITSLRTESNGYTRESAPSACKSITVGSGQYIQLVISNVPGALAYKVYASTNGSCTGLGLVSTVSNPVINPSNQRVSGCPDTASPPGTNCMLGQSPATYDGNTPPPDITKPPPSPSAAPFASGLPNQSPTRAIPPSGDRANENLCTALASPTVAITCPLAGARAANTTFVTPGAVQMKVTQGTCINVLAGDAYLFSGYQYNWIINHEPASTTCTNSWNGVVNSAAIGMSYTPGAAFTIAGNTGSNNNTWSFAAPMGGILAATIHIGWSSGLVIDFDSHYAPGPPGARLYT